MNKIKRLSLVFILLNTMLLQSIYADILFYYNTAVLSAITSKIPGPGEGVIVGRAHIGCLENARVDIYKVNNDGSLALQWVEKTSSGEILDTIGKFDLHIDALEEETFYIYKASGGVDWDVDNNGIKDETATVNSGTIRAIAKGKDIVALGDKFRITVPSEILFLKTEQMLKHQFDSSTFLNVLNAEAKLLMNTEGALGDLNADGVVNYVDTLAYDSVNGKETLSEEFKTYIATNSVHNGDNALLNIGKGHPSIHLIGTNTMYILLNSTYIDPGAVASDDKDINIIVFTQGNVNSDLEGVYTQNYRSIDSGGRAATPLVRTIHVVATLPSRIVLNGEQQLLVTRNSNVSDPGASATDISGVALDVTMPSIDTSTVGSYTVEYAAEDLAGEILSTERTIHVTLEDFMDIEPPKVVSSDVTIATTCTPVDASYYNVFTRCNPSAHDDDNVIDPNGSGMPEVRTDEQVYGAIGFLTQKGIDAIQYHIADEYTIYFAARDRAGNFSQKRTTITLYNQQPTLYLNESNMITEVYLNHSYVEKGADGYDRCGNDVTITITNNINTSVLGEYEVKYVAEDSEGTRATLIRRVLVILDPNIPIISLNGESVITLDYGVPYVETASVYDNADGNTLDLVIIGSVNSNVAGTYILTYNATDSAGNKAITKTRTVIILEEDVTAPVVTLYGENPLTLALFSPYQEEEASATDDRDAYVNVSISGTVNTSQAGTYKIYYTARDKAGNIGQAIRTVIVAPAEFVPPVITMYGASSITLPLYSSYTDAGASAYDESDGSITVIVSGSVDTYTPGTYIITYNATDSSGNKAIEKSRTVIVLSADTTAPVVTLNGQTNVTIAQYATYTEAGASAEDNRDGVLPVTIVSGSVNTSNPGIYKLYYQAKDQAGNVGQAIRVVTVVKKDTKPPFITCSGEVAFSVPIGSYVRPTCTATDNVDGSVPVFYSYANGIAKGYLKNGAPSGNTKGVYVLIATATDKAGNSSRRFRYIYYGISLAMVNLQAAMDRVRAVYGES